jgi:hypothetical protein
LEESKSCLNNDQVHIFLREHLLYWLEAISLLGITSESIVIIQALVLYGQSVIEQPPLKIYCSAFVFTQGKALFGDNLRSLSMLGFQRKPKVQEDWSAVLRIFEGYSNCVMSVAFLSDGKIVVSGSSHGTFGL